MPTPKQSLEHSAQTGGITILVALMMLVLLTLSAIGMSRNSFREVVSSGFSRQGAMAREVADSGLEWSVYWISKSNAPAATGQALQLNNQMTLQSQEQAQAGFTYDITTGNAYAPGGTLQPAMEVPGPTGTTQGYTIGVTYMGQSNSTTNLMSQSSGQNAFTPAAGGANGNNASPLPTAWSIRSDAQVQQGGVTFIHGREIWMTKPVQ